MLFENNAFHSNFISRCQQALKDPTLDFKKKQKCLIFLNLNEHSLNRKTAKIIFGNQKKILLDSFLGVNPDLPVNEIQNYPLDIEEEEGEGENMNYFKNKHILSKNFIVEEFLKEYSNNKNKQDARLSKDILFNY